MNILNYYRNLLDIDEFENCYELRINAKTVLK